MQYLIECQGYDIDEYVVFQDNMSMLLLEAKYFLIKNYYDVGEIDVKFCPTNEM
jgi:hypothetical protein